MRIATFLAAAGLSVSAFAQQSSPLDPTVVLKQAKAASVLIMTGEGAGRLQSIGTGVVVSKDGVILTALHVIKGAAEVQVRMSNGEIFDHAELLGSDERRDIAAIKIPAAGLSALPLGSSEQLVEGSPVYAVTNANGLNWSATSGIVSAIRPADEVPGAGDGYRVIQFTDPIAPGASGGPLVDGSGALVGIIIRRNQTAGLAVPVESVAGLPQSEQHIALGAGALLRLPTQNSEPQSSAAVADANPQQILKRAKTVCVQSKTSFLTVDTLDRALMAQRDWRRMDITIVQDPRVADLLIQIDRPLFTYVHTFVIVDKRTSLVLGTGKVTAFDGTIASGGLAKDIAKIFFAARLAQTGDKKASAAN